QPVQGASPQEQRKQMREAFRRQGQPSGNIDDEIDQQTSETRDFTINGESVPFEFIKGTAPNGGAPTRQVGGLFPGRNGMVMVMVMVPESEYNEDAIVKMIESIRLPPEDFAEDMDDDGTKPAEKAPGENNSPAETEGPATDTPAESSP